MAYGLTINSACHKANERDNQSATKSRKKRQLDNFSNFPEVLILELALDI